MEYEYDIGPANERIVELERIVAKQSKDYSDLSWEYAQQGLDLDDYKALAKKTAVQATEGIRLANSFREMLTRALEVGEDLVRQRDALLAGTSAKQEQAEALRFKGKD